MATHLSSVENSKGSIAENWGSSLVEIVISNYYNIKQNKEICKCFIDVGTGGTGSTCPPRFCNKQRSALFIFRKCPFFLGKKCPQNVMPPSLRCFLHPCLQQWVRTFWISTNYVVMNFCVPDKIHRICGCYWHNTSNCSSCQFLNWMLFCWVIWYIHPLNKKNYYKC